VAQPHKLPPPPNLPARLLLRHRHCVPCAPLAALCRLQGGRKEGEGTICRIHTALLQTSNASEHQHQLASFQQQQGAALLQGMQYPYYAQGIPTMYQGLVPAASPDAFQSVCA
jgi:hypothetical protein